MRGKADKPERRKTGQTRRAVLELAEQLVEERGYHAFSYRDIATRLGIKNAAIHYYFQSKADLGEALVDCYRTRFADWAQKVEAASGNARDWLDAYFNVYIRILSGGKPDIFSSGILNVEFRTLPGPMQDKIRMMLRERYAWLASAMRRGRENGQLHYNGTPEAKALEIAAATQGALQISRVVGRGEERFCQVVEQIQHDLAPVSGE
jgi:TetR/AcrR family transcriptional repressor of nem operon